jgi:hypothetical protein
MAISLAHDPLQRAGDERVELRPRTALDLRERLTG